MENWAQKLSNMIAIFIFLLGPTFALSQTISGVHEEHYGYVDNIEAEKNTIITEMILVPRTQQNEKSLKDKIFDKKLTEDIQSRYKQRFGYTESEQNFDNQYNRYEDVVYSTFVRVTPEENSEREEEFGDFLVRRLIEHHLDEYSKKNENIRPAYEFKKKMSNLNVEVKKGYKFSARYSLSGEDFRFKLQNPYNIGNEVIITDVETIYFIGLPLTKTVNLSTYYSIEKERVNLILRKYHTPTFSTYIQARGYPNYTDLERDQRLILGFTWQN